MFLFKLLLNYSQMLCNTHWCLIPFFVYCNSLSVFVCICDLFEYSLVHCPTLSHRFQIRISQSSHERMANKRKIRCLCLFQTVALLDDFITFGHRFILGSCTTTLWLNRQFHVLNPIDFLLFYAVYFIFVCILCSLIKLNLNWTFTDRIFRIIQNWQLTKFARFKWLQKKIP